MSVLVMARRSLVQFRTNPLRTLLTLLGVVFGVAAVVAMVSIGEGAQREILATIEKMGATSIHVHAKPVADNKLGELVKDSLGLTRADAWAIERTIPAVDAVAWRKRHDLAVTDLPVSAQDIHVYGVSEHIFEVHNLSLSSGRRFLQSDHQRNQRVAVIGAELARTAFGSDDAVGEVIRLDYAYFTVVGVLADRGVVTNEDGEEEESVMSGAQWQNYAASVMIPYDTMRTELMPAPVYGELDTISAKVPTTEQTLTGKQAIVALLTQLHGGRSDFDVVAPEEILRQKQQTQSVLNMVLVAIAAISLVVGGIGVMNIMLANIMERVSEIGLRRAVGARRRDIRNQFLLESIIVCVIGGLLGIVLGFSISWIVSMTVGLPIAFAWESMLLSFGISLIVGVTFGLMPAIRAANVNPIEALRGD